MPGARAGTDNPSLSVHLREPEASPTSIRFASCVRTAYWYPSIAMIERDPLSELRQALATYANRRSVSHGLGAQSARGACLLLADLAEQDWHVEPHGREVWVSPPTSSTAEGESLISMGNCLPLSRHPAA
jgi:hypothetical protein